MATQTQQLLKQGQQYTDPRGNTGIVNFSTATGKQLAPGANTYVQNFVKGTDNTMDSSRLFSSSNTIIPDPVNANLAQRRFSSVVAGAMPSASTTGSDTSVTDVTVTENKNQGILDSMLESIKSLSNKGKKTAELQEQEGVAEKKKQSTDLENKYIATQRSYEKQIEEAQLNKEGKFGGALEADILAIKRQRDNHLADISISYKIAQGAYTDAVELIDSQIEAEFEPIQNQIDSFARLYQLKQDDFSESEKFIAQNLLDEKQRTKDYQMQADRDAKLQQYDLDKIAAQRSYGSSGKSGGGSLSDSGDFEATINQVANLEGTVAGKNAVASQLKQMIANKDYASAYNQIANTVETGLVGEAKQRYSNARTDYQVLGGLKDAIQEYSDAGGDMGLLKGGADKIVSRLGRVNDPRFKQLATQLQREFQTYRNVMTGAAFSPEESREYASVNPTGGKSLDLNLSVVNGALNQLENRVTGTINARIPSAQYILEYATGAGKPNSSNTKANDDPLGLFN